MNFQRFVVEKIDRINKNWPYCWSALVGAAYRKVGLFRCTVTEFNRLIFHSLGMSVQIQLDDHKRSYTNLDSIGGRIVLSLSHDESISAIVVKLEGESKSVIARVPTDPRAFHDLDPSPSLVTKEDQRLGSTSEKHKILYEVSQVFPTQTSAARGGTATDPIHTLRAGQHEYPFKFKIPLDNGCSHLPSQQIIQNTTAGPFGK
jgi:hypothetical protein